MYIQMQTNRPIIDHSIFFNLKNSALDKANELTHILLHEIWKVSEWKLLIKTYEAHKSIILRVGHSSACLIVNGGDGIFVSKWGFHTIDWISAMIQL